MRRYWESIWGASHRSSIRLSFLRFFFRFCCCRADFHCFDQHGCASFLVPSFTLSIVLSVSHWLRNFPKFYLLLFCIPVLLFRTLIKLRFILSRPPALFFFLSLSLSRRIRRYFGNLDSHSAPHLNTAAFELRKIARGWTIHELVQPVINIQWESRLNLRAFYGTSWTSRGKTH